MIVVCPKCNTKYRIKDELIDPEGTKLKCSRCGNIFVYPQKSEEEKKEEKIEKKSEIDTKFPQEKISLEQPVIKEKKGLKKLVIVLFLFLGVVAGVGLWHFYPSISEKLPFLSKSKTKLKKISSNATSVEAVKKISIEDVKQYFVKNEKIGNILVIEGRAVNNFDKPKDLIKIEASLFDNKGNIVAKKTILCGNKVSLFQLQSWPEKRLEKELNSKVGILMKNTNIPPGGSVDFMILFYNPPNGVAEYGLQVVQALDVQQK